MADAAYILEVKHLCQTFESGRGRKKITVKAVDDVSFAIRPSETFGLVGESGCGKTTTGRTIIRLYDPASGQVFFNGREISGRMTKELRRYLTENIAMIFQDPIESLNPRMTIEEIVGEGLKVRGVKDKQEIRRRVNEMLCKVGLTQEHATRYPHEFSGGQRQRIGIARAMITKPKLIIADEPVSALDVSIQAQVINLLNDLKEEMGLTVLFIAHNLSVVKYFSDRIGVMYYGRLVEVARGDDRCTRTPARCCRRSRSRIRLRSVFASASTMTRRPRTITAARRRGWWRLSRSTLCTARPPRRRPIKGSWGCKMVPLSEISKRG